MIEIKKVTDPAVRKSICNTYGIILAETDRVIATVENGVVLHCAVFNYEGEDGKIKVISGFDDDLALLDGLCRAILNILDINGVKVVYLSDKYAKLAEYVGFVKEKDTYKLNLEGFFHCGCSHNNQ